MITISRSVNFGANKGGLSTVGFTLYNPDGTVFASRETAGIVEIVTGKGIYACSINFADAWSGLVVWDTGEATPIYAVDQFDYRKYSGSGGGSGGGGSIIMPSYEEEFKRLRTLINRVLKALKELPNPSDVVENGFKTVISANKEAKDALLAAINAENPQLKSLIEGLEVTGEALEALIETKEFEQITKEIEHVENT